MDVCMCICMQDLWAMRNGTVSFLKMLVILWLSRSEM